MQPLARDGFTAEQVTAALTGPRLATGFGCDLLTPSLGFVADISADLAGWTVHRSNLADVHGTVDLAVSRLLAWGFDRVRPWMVLGGCRWNQGVYVLTSPDTNLGESPQSYQVTGFDQLHVLQGPVGNSYSVALGANVLGAVRAAITAAEVVAPVLLDSSGSSKVMAAAKVWPLTSSENPTWLGVINDLLALIGYRGIWADWDGALRSGPCVLPAGRPSEFRLDVGSMTRGIVAPERAVSNDLWGVPNWFRVIANQDTPPVEGAGMYTQTNPSSGPSSIASVGRTVRAPVVFLDAASQADLVVQGDRLFGVATRVSEVITAKLSPFPALWHADRLTYADAALGGDREILVREWSLSSDGSDMPVTSETVA